LAVPVAIGVDLGTSGVKVIARDETGTVLARARHGYPTARPEPEAAEQSPRDWLSAIDAALTELAATVEPSNWSAVGLSGMLPTLVSLDESLRPVGPALTWEDGRADPEGERLVADRGDSTIYRLTGQRLDGRYLLPMHARRSTDPRFAAAQWAISAKDYLFLHFTGELCTDPSTASGFGAYDLASRQWITDLVERAGSPLLPAVAPSSYTTPLLSAVASRWGCRSGIPIVLGAADSVLGGAALELHTGEAGGVAYVAGTSTAIIGASTTAQLDPEGRYLVTPLVGDGYGLEMDLLATGSAMAWLAELFGLDGGAASLSELAASAEVSRAPLVLPYLSPGEQGALWDPSLPAAIIGLTLGTSRAELARGLLAGIVLESKRCIDVLAEQRVGTEGPLLISGSGGTSARFRQDLADATGLEVRFDPSETDHSALGAAQLAGRAALGWNPAPVRATSGRSTRVIVTRPDPGRADFWSERFGRHEDARLRLKETAPHVNRSTP
jgi:sugar (pentulose or hexulose) kinase